MNKEHVSEEQASDKQAVIAANTRITLHFSIHLANGELVDSTRDKAPARFVFGDGNLLPGFEKCLLGLSSGDNRSFILPAKSAFGEYNPDNEHAIARTQFAPSMPLEPGILVAFQGADGEELPGLIKSVNEQFVLIDFNHPLAGKEIVFEAEIIKVEPLNAQVLVEWIEQTMPSYASGNHNSNGTEV